MKRFSMILFVLAAFVVSATAFAQTTFQPLQPADTGIWAADNANGDGINVAAYRSATGNRAGVIVYVAGRQELGTVPYWVFGEGRWSGNVSFIELTKAVFTVGGEPGGPVVGSIETRPGAKGKLLAVVTIDGVSKAYTLSKLTANTETPFVCISPDFSPPAPGCAP